jgi:acetoacetyl-CoA synthetase
MAAQEVEDGVPGELVATKAFPTMPLTFMGEDGPKRYFSSYFERFDNVWTHGDFIMIHPITKGVYFLGRADGVLNPSGVRFGSAEIYSIIEARFSEVVADSICVGQRRPQDDDERVVLFLMMKPEKKFTRQLVRDVKEEIRRKASPRHVPKFVFETKDIPVSACPCPLTLFSFRF